MTMRRVLLEKIMEHKNNSTCVNMNIKQNHGRNCQGSAFARTDASKNDASYQEFYLEDSERQKCEVWSRVMGYYRPTASYNVGKKSEYDDRKCFSEPSKEKLDAISKTCGDCISRAA